MKQVGLRIDVDTFCGTRDGVRGCCLLSQHGFRQASFSASGRTIWGRHLWRLIKPEISVEDVAFQRPLHSGGWDILLAGIVYIGRYR